MSWTHWSGCCGRTRYRRPGRGQPGAHRAAPAAACDRPPAESVPPLRPPFALAFAGARPLFVLDTRERCGGQASTRRRGRRSPGGRHSGGGLPSSPRELEPASRASRPTPTPPSAPSHGSGTFTEGTYKLPGPRGLRRYESRGSQSPSELPPPSRPPRPTCGGQFRRVAAGPVRARSICRVSLSLLTALESGELVHCFR